MSRTTKRMIFTDPIMRKGHYHATRAKEPDVDEQLDMYYEDEAEEQLAREQWAAQNQEDDNYV